MPTTEDTTEQPWSKFGLGSIKLTEDGEIAILTQAGWDGESVPYPILVEWFENSLDRILADIVAFVDPDPNVGRALAESTYLTSGVPDKELP